MTKVLRIEILGTGCKKCKQLEANTREAFAACNLVAEVVLVTDMMQIAMRGVMATPALVINDEVMCQGAMMSAEEIVPHFV